jgi:DNA-binding transcriptional MerR regulator
MARVSLEFLGRLEAEDLMQPHTPEGREPGYTPEDILRLTLICRLHETLGLDLAAIEVVLHLREQMFETLTRIEEMQRRFARREQELLRELNQLRRNTPVTRK